ncbi:hypothetical protein EXU57_10995 [Segetibacter sp. 3557_3]|uniref:hypothetical protein n=1 Tax=Segetibacter sp. 3557_3 TaxID=2547429 RepID=UPI00105883FA|nr:hypothetical protein [Segetibacter sp. 3557_3]TDH26607.1 hypothetical protein EXU57_10995 [Segetibacter sp. 3557_3]
MKIFKIISFALVVAAGTVGCKKPDAGYLSKVIVYSPKTLNAARGRVTTSAALLVDGSTNPIYVKLLGTRNFYTKQNADSILLKKYEIAIYKGEINQQDTTLEQVAAKISKAMYPSFAVNPIGGRLEVTPATNSIDTGTYEFDIEVSNIAGKREVLNAGVIRIINPANSYELISSSVTTSPTTSETTTGQTNFTTTIVRTNTTENKVIIRYVDKNGTPFNPKAGEVVPRADRPDFRTYAPFYPEEKTDTALVFRYPPNLPTFPLYPQVNVSGGLYSYVFYYRVRAAATDINLNMNPVITFRLWPAPGDDAVKGTYVITMRMNFVARK